jgi:dTDP-4-amino-4,6-dideoxygalactose transaminase
VGVHYPPIHLTTYYSQTFGYRTGAFPVAEDLGGRCLSLPFFADITPEEQAYVVDKVREFYDDAG